MRSIAVIILASFLPFVAHAQQLTSTEWSLGAVADIAHYTFAGAELGFAHRPGNDTRVAFALAGGALGGRLAGRAQLTAQILVNSSARSGPGLYAGMGGAAVVRRDSHGQAFLVVLIGLEAAPGSRRGWYVEAGVAGGLRAAAGWRMRRFPRWWR
ncbi:MAG TPA: hypothetical protein VKQ05_11570 [Gemmatimonadales bacterium]|nr:hypothetical protein [Gemmatimonadales bacterium]